MKDNTLWAKADYLAEKSYGYVLCSLIFPAVLHNRLKKRNTQKKKGLLLSVLGYIHILLIFVSLDLHCMAKKIFKLKLIFLIKPFVGTKIKKN